MFSKISARDASSSRLNVSGRRRGSRPAFVSASVADREVEVANE